MTPDVLLDIDNLIKENAKVTLTKMAQTISRKKEINISKTTISRGCNLLRYHYKPPQRTINLTEIQKLNRVNFSKIMLSKSFNGEVDLHSIVFSDESRFILGDDKQWVWRSYGEKNGTAVRKTDKFPPSLMIYGAIGKGYKSHLVFCETTIDSYCYRRNIEESGMIEHLDSERGRGKYIFMQDGARCHFAKDTINWLKNKCRFISKWPANSPDLNPIENFWGAMKEAVAKIAPKTIDELRRVIFDVWEHFDQNTIDNLVESFYQRLALVIQQNGECIQSWLRKGLSSLQITVPRFDDVDSTVDIISILEDPIEEEETPQILTTDFTPEEDKYIIKLYLKLGPKWTKMANIIQVRTPNQIRYHFRKCLQSKLLNDSSVNETTE